MKQVLLATTNKGKVKEIAQFLGDLPFEFVSLSDLPTVPPPPDEVGETSEQNAILKAKYYAHHAGMLTIADDSGLFIDALDGWPGIRAADVAGNADEKCQIVLEKMNGKEDRRAHFETVVACFDPISNTMFLSEGSSDVQIADHMPEDRKHGFGYDPILLVPEFDKTVDSLTTAEKNGFSSRGKALIKIKRYLHNQYRGKHFVVPIALIVKDGKLLMNKRNDPHNPKVHGIMEFPGGSVEMGEDIMMSLRKECREEVGYEVEILAPLSNTFVKTFEYDEGDCQFYIMPYVCKIIGGELSPNDEEVLSTHWMSYDEALGAKKFPGDTEMLEASRSRFEALVKEYNL